MTVTADNKRRIPLRMAQPGDRFDVQVSSEGKLVLTKLVPASKPHKPNRVRMVKRGSYHVGVSDRPIDMQEVQKLLGLSPTSTQSASRMICQPWPGIPANPNR